MNECHFCFIETRNTAQFDDCCRTQHTSAIQRGLPVGGVISLFISDFLAAKVLSYKQLHCATFCLGFPLILLQLSEIPLPCFTGAELFRSCSCVSRLQHVRLLLLLPTAVLSWFLCCFSVFHLLIKTLTQFSQYMQDKKSQSFLYRVYLLSTSSE